MQNRATQRRKPNTIDRKETIFSYFFDRKEQPDGSTVLAPKTSFVTREELFWVLEWQSRRLPEHNRWYRVLWRWITRKDVVVYDPFAMIAMKTQRPDPSAPPKTSTSWRRSASSSCCSPSGSSSRCASCGASGGPS